MRTLELLLYLMVVPMSLLVRLSHHMAIRECRALSLHPRLRLALMVLHFHQHLVTTALWLIPRW